MAHLKIDKATYDAIPKLGRSDALSLTSHARIHSQQRSRSPKMKRLS